MQFFMPMIPPTVTHNDMEVHTVKTKTGKMRAVIHDSARLKDARAKLHAHLAQHKPKEPMLGALRLVVKWGWPATAEHPNGEYKITKPDTDNLEKVLKDEMTKLGYWKDDAQVASEIVEKFWADIPGIFVSLEELT